MSCNKCSTPSCNGQCNTTYQNYPCPSFPPPPGPAGPQGPAGVQGPPGVSPTFNVVLVDGAFTPLYTIDGTEDVLLVNTTFGAVTIQLLQADNVLSQRGRLTIKDAYGTVNVNDIRILSVFPDLIDQSPLPVFLSITSGLFGSVTLVSNKLPLGLGGGFNII